MLFKSSAISSTLRNVSSVRRKLANLAYIVASIAHITACGWFYIGSHYKVLIELQARIKLFPIVETSLQDWFPGRGVSWYSVEPDMIERSFINYNKFGMHSDATVWEQYLLSFYWVCTTLTGNGLIGDEMPQNVVEMIYCIGLMVISLTLFRYSFFCCNILVVHNEFWLCVRLFLSF